MTYPIFAAGQRLTAGQLAALQATEVIQGSVLTVNNSDVFVNSNIVVPTVANARYRFDLLAAYTSAENVKFDWTGPTGFGVDRYNIGRGSGATGGSGDASSISLRRMLAGDSVSIDGATNVDYFEFGIITGGTSDGDVILRFSQNVVAASDSSLSAATRIWFIRVD